MIPLIFVDNTTQTLILGKMSIKERIKEVRTNYTLDKLSEDQLSETPFELFKTWMSDALEKAMEPNAMVLATIGLDGFPDERVVLLRDFSEQGLKFYTNYQSEKAKQMAKNAKVSALFFWPELERQIRVTGVVSKISDKESDEYFASRPRQSQLGAWASSQSETLENREILEKRLQQLELQYQGKEVPRPSHWGGYRIDPKKFEFWQGGAFRLHDRFVYTESDAGKWNIKRLHP